jgi:hypothetical protein
MARAPSAPFELAVDRVVDACAGHDRQAVKALAFSPSNALRGVLAHDPIVWTETAPSRVEALCELEANGTFDPTAVLFSADHTLVLAARPGELRMYELETGALRWQRALPWWELFERDPETLVCLQYQTGAISEHALVDVRTGALSERVELSASLDPPTATLAKDRITVFSARDILPIELARPWTTVGEVRPAFSLDPNAHAHLWPRKVCRGELFLALSHSSQILQAFASREGGRRWQPERGSTALATLDQGRVIVAVRDTIPVTLVLIDALSGRDALAMRLPTEQAEAVVAAAVDLHETQLALATTLGRAIVLSLARVARAQ